MRTSLLAVSILFLVLPGISHAAAISMEYRMEGDDIRGRVILDPEGEHINVIEGTITVPEDFSVARIESGAGVFPFWIVEPLLEGGIIRFAGMAPGGFEGVVETAGITAPGELFSIFFSGTGYPRISDATFKGYLHDGVGTPTEVRFQMTTSTPRSSEPMSDQTPPPAIEAYLVPESVMSPTLLVARASDEAGVSRYEVSIALGPWEVFTSPREVSADESVEMIVVRAFDYAGNYREVTVQQAKPERARHPYWLYAIVGCLLLLLLLFLLYRRRRS